MPSYKIQMSENERIARTKAVKNERQTFLIFIAIAVGIPALAMSLK